MTRKGSLSRQKHRNAFPGQMGWWWIAGCLVGFVWKAGVQLTVLGKADWCVCVCVCVLQYVAAAQLCGQMRPLTLASEAKVAQRWVLQSRGSDSHPPKEESRVLPGEAIEG